MTEDQLIIWAAGFFDGEGCVSVCRQRRKDTTRYSYMLQVSVCQKEPAPLLYFQNMFGGLLYEYKVRGIAYWRWEAHGNGARRALEALHSYLILKDARAAIGIDFQKKLVKWNVDYGRVGYPDHVNAAREDFYQRMRVLNQRGVSDTNPNPKRSGPQKGHGVSSWDRYRKSKEKESSATIQ